MIDFEWSCAAPFEVELHRGIGFLRKDPLWLPVFWEEMDARGLCRPPAYELRSDVCMVEKLIGKCVLRTLSSSSCSCPPICWHTVHGALVLHCGVCGCRCHIVLALRSIRAADSRQPGEL